MNSEKKTKFLIFRVTREERTKIEKKSQEGGFKKLSDYLRDKLGL